MHRKGDRGQVTFVILDGGRVVDMQKQTLPAGVDTIEVGGAKVDLGSCASL
ncbi:MAG: hypothetical protein AAGF67_18400 [Verrucomicrobiota bacterium]